MEKVNGFIVFWMEQDPWDDAGDNRMSSRSMFYKTSEMALALTFMESLRKLPTHQFVTMASQNSNSVGKAGVDTVANGKTPDGVEYDWNKNSRIGATRR